MARRKNKNIDFVKLLMKAFFTGIPFSMIAFVTFFVLDNVKNMSLAAPVILILSALALAWALTFRKGKENYFEAIVSFALVIGVWGVVGILTGFQVFPTVQVTNLTEWLILLAQFFTAEGLTQRIMKDRKLI